MFEEKIGKDCEICEKDCKTLIEKFLSICVPVMVIPNVEVKPVKTECCGKPIITPKHGACCKKGVENGNCEFAIIQKMKVEIPISFNAKTVINEAFVDCELKNEIDDLEI